MKIASLHLSEAQNLKVTPRLYRKICAPLPQTTSKYARIPATLRIRREAQTDGS